MGGVLLACFSITQFIFAPIWGRLSDRVGRRPLILLSLVGSAISFFFFGWAPNLAVLFVARVAAGILSSASLPTAQAYIADVTPPEKRAAIGTMTGICARLATSTCATRRSPCVRCAESARLTQRVHDGSA